jgi:hypothetical protein
VQQPADKEGLTPGFEIWLRQKGWNLPIRNTDSVIQDGLKELAALLEQEMSH